MTINGHPQPRRASVLGVDISIVDYEHAVNFIIDAARAGESRTVSAMAVHGVMTGVLDRVHRNRLNAFDMLTPDGQPVRWALNALSQACLSDRVYGPELTRRVCAAAARERIGVYLYGSRLETVKKMRDRLSSWYPDLRVVGIRPSRFRIVTAEEDMQDVEDINQSGARIVFVGLGCPRQERWAHDHRQRIRAVSVCVGAAFDFHAGSVTQAPAWMQRTGLEWLFRLGNEPRRLWKRYLLLNPLYLALILLQATRIWKPRSRI